MVLRAESCLSTQQLLIPQNEYECECRFTFEKNTKGKLKASAETDKFQISFTFALAQKFKTRQQSTYKCFCRPLKLCVGNHFCWNCK